MARNTEELVQDLIMRELLTEAQLRQIVSDPTKVLLVIEDELFDKDKGSHDAVKACAIEYPSNIVISSDKDRKFVGFPNVIADHGATQRYAGVDQTNIPCRTAKAHYINEHYPSDAIVVFLHQSETEFPRTTFDCWMQGYDSLEYFFNWLVELKISSEGRSSG